MIGNRSKKQVFATRSDAENEKRAKKAIWEDEIFEKQGLLSAQRARKKKRYIFEEKRGTLEGAPF